MGETFSGTEGDSSSSNTTLLSSAVAVNVSDVSGSVFVSCSVFVSSSVVFVSSSVVFVSGSMFVSFSGDTSSTIVGLSRGDGIGDSAAPGTLVVGGVCSTLGIGVFLSEIAGSGLLAGEHGTREEDGTTTSGDSISFVVEPRWWLALSG